MEITKTIFLLLAFSIFGTINSQEKEDKQNEDAKVSYYKKRAKEDAKFEKEFKANTKKEERKFWKHQKSYERELKSNDKVAYEVYMQGKKDAYSEQHDYCSNHHCNHSYYYHNHAKFYYHYEYRRQPKSRSSTSVKVGLPRVKIGLF